MTKEEFDELQFFASYYDDDFITELETLFEQASKLFKEYKPLSPEDTAKVHEEWLKRNGSWAEEKLKVPYEQLPEVEKEKDRVQLVPAIAKVKAYKNGEIDIDSLCEQYGIEKGRAI